jgi:hypothetical protein
MLDRVSLDCRLAQSPGGLEVTYTITNGGDVDIGAFNRLQGIATDGALDFSPDSIFTDIDGDLLRLLKMALPIPAGLRVTAYVPPYATLVPSGKSFTEQVRVPLPVKVRQPFKRALIRGEVVPVKPVTAKRAEVVLGVFPLVACGLAPEHPAFPDVMTAAPPDPAVRGQVTLSASFTLSPDVPVLDYQGFPWP